ncbi:Vacuolar protein sorting-associated protein 68 [Verticillium dahliae]
MASPVGPRAAPAKQLCHPRNTTTGSRHPATSNEPITEQPHNITADSRNHANPASLIAERCLVSATYRANRPSPNNPKWRKSVSGSSASPSGSTAPGRATRASTPRAVSYVLTRLLPPLPILMSLRLAELTRTPLRQFSLAFYVMLDSAVWSKTLNGSDTHVTFVDWLPLLFSSLGMLIINSVEKTRLSADSFSYSGNGVAWKARVVLFLGFAALAGGMAGGVTVFVLKFVVRGVAMPALSMGVENVVANALVMLSSVVLWVSQNMEDEYSYNLSL